MNPDQQEHDRCVEDAEYFINTYCKLKSDKGAGLIPFKLFDYQREVLEQVKAHQELILLKARQLGMTELFAAYSVWKTLKPRVDVIVISQGEDEAGEFVFKAYTAWEGLPDFLRIPLKNANKTSTLEFRNGSRIMPKPATARAGRSFNAQLLIFDEWAHQMFQEKIYAAAAPTALSAGNQIIGLSTANGAGNGFHRMWLLAKQGLGAHPIFLPWDIRPGRDEAWIAEQTKTMEPWQRAQEFPKTPDEAFILSGRPRFDHDALNEIARSCVKPANVAPLGTTSQGRAEGYLRIWEEPMPGRRYVAGADTAEGLPKGDFSICVVFDFETGLEVAELHGHWETDVFAAHMANLCRKYNTALLGVELNNHGHAVMLALRSIEHYPESSLYRHKEYDARKAQPGKYGWLTTSKSKPVMVDALAKTIVERRPYRNELFIAEAQTYTIGENGDTNASGSMHDDRVMAYGIAEQMRRQPEETPALAPVGLHKASMWRQASINDGENNGY